MKSSSQEAEVTRSLSNVIKSYNIRYSEEKKEIDMNQRAEEFQRLYIESLPKFKEIEDTEQELQETYFLTDDSGMIFPQDEEEIAEYCNNAKSRLEAELKQLREAAEEECRLLRLQAEDECQNLVSSTAQSAEEERKRILNEAQELGYQEGRNQALQELEALRTELMQKAEQQDMDYEQKIKSLEPDLIELVSGLVTNLTGVIVEEKREIILHLIHRGLLGVEDCKSFIIRVSKADYEFLNTKKQELTDELQGSRIEILADPMLQSMQCTIETDTRIVDCSLDVQLKNLTTDLKLLAGIL